MPLHKPGLLPVTFAMVGVPHAGPWQLLHIYFPQMYYMALHREVWFFTPCLKYLIKNSVFIPFYSF